MRRAATWGSATTSGAALTGPTGTTPFSASTTSAVVRAEVHADMVSRTNGPFWTRSRLPVLRSSVSRSVRPMIVQSRSQWFWVGAAMAQCPSMVG